MAEITNFEFLGSDKNITKVEVSLDGGLTYGVLWANSSTSGYYELIPVNDNGDFSSVFNFTIPDTNNDYGFSIKYNIVYQESSETRVVKSGTQSVGPYSSPGVYYADISDSYNGQWYSFEVEINISLAQPPIITNGWYIRDPYTDSIDTNFSGQCYDVKVSFEVYDPVNDTYFMHYNYFEVPFGYENTEYPVTLSYTEYYYDSEVGYEKSYSISYPYYIYVY